MMDKLNFNAYVGTATGIFKGINAIEKSDFCVKYLDGLKSATNKNPITAMNWGEGFEEEVVLGFHSHQVKIYDVKTNKITMSEEKECGEGAIIGVSRHKTVLLTAVESGIIKLWRNDMEPLVINTGGPLEKMRPSPQYSNIIATGGKENDLKLWDLQTGKQTFDAKNVRHDELELRVPVWVSDMAFVPSSGKVAVSTRHGYVRLYDPSTNTRRPVVSVKVPEQALTCITCSSKDHHVIVGSGSGQMNLIDLRSPGLVLNKYRGFVGGIKAIACSEGGTHIASVSLDRHFRVHHLNTKKLLLSKYMQSKLNCLVIKSNFDITEKETDEESNEKEEEEREQQDVNNEIGVEENDVDTIEIKKEESDSEEEEEEIFKSMPLVGSKRSKGNILGKKKHKS